MKNESFILRVKLSGLFGQPRMGRWMARSPATILLPPEDSSEYKARPTGNSSDGMENQDTV